MLAKFLPEHYVTFANNFIIVYDPAKAKLKSIIEKKYSNKQILVPKIGKKIYEKFINFIFTYKLFSENEKICIAWSGGKDSTLLLLLIEPIARLLSLDVHVVTVDVRPNNCCIWSREEFIKIYNFYSNELNFKFKIIEGIDFQINKQPCYLCSALRREKIIEYCKENEINKLVLAHTLDDVIETIFIMAYKSKKIKLLSPIKYLSAKKIKIGNYEIYWDNIIIVKPMLNIAEIDIIKFFEEVNLPYFEDKKFCPYSAYYENSLRGKIDKIVKKLYEIDENYLYNFITSINKSLK